VTEPAPPEVFLSFEEAPIDEYDPELDGDNSVLTDAPWANPRARPLSETAAKSLSLRVSQAHLSTTSIEAANRRIVPHPRDLKFGSIGWDVLALQRALSTAKLRRWGTFTRVYGTGTRAEIARFQQTHALHVDGVYGTNTHRKLGPYYDARGIWLLNRVHVVTPAQHRQAQLLAAAMILYNRRSIVHYTEGPARMWIVRNRYTLDGLRTMAQDWEDCSSSVTGIYKIAALDDPNGLRFNGMGYTGTLAEHGVTIAAAQAQIGSLYLYGHFPYSHVTMNVGVGRAFSHGSESGPLILAPDYRLIGNVRRYPGLP
jgi:hypothetical protein